MISAVAAKVCKLWQTFWFAQVDLLPLCVFRIAFGTFSLLSVLCWMPDLFTFFGQHGMVTVETMQRFAGTSRFSLLYLFPCSDAWLVGLYCLLVAAAIGTAIGFRTRVSLALFLILLISFHHRNLAILIGSDELMVAFAFILMISPCDRLLSLDRSLAARQTTLPEERWQPTGNVWPQRLLQLQVAAVYFQSFFGKMNTEVWRNGTAIYYTARTSCFTHLPVPYVFNHLWSCQMITWLTLLIELFLFTLIWVRAWRYWVLLAGLFLHAAIEWSMNIPFFEYMMMISYISFLDGKDMRQFFTAAATRLGHAANPPRLPEGHSS